MRSVHLLKLKREGFYGVIKTIGSVKPQNTSMLDEKQVASLRKRGFVITTVNRVWQESIMVRKAINFIRGFFDPYDYDDDETDMSERGNNA